MKQVSDIGTSLQLNILFQHGYLETIDPIKFAWLWKNKGNKKYAVISESGVRLVKHLIEKHKNLIALKILCAHGLNG